MQTWCKLLVLLLALVSGLDGPGRGRGRSRGRGRGRASGEPSGQFWSITLTPHTHQHRVEVPAPARMHLAPLNATADMMNNAFGNIQDPAGGGDMRNAFLVSREVGMRNHNPHNQVSTTKADLTASSRRAIDDAFFNMSAIFK